MKIPYSREAITAACREVVRENGLKGAYIRPIAFRGYGELGVAGNIEQPASVSIAAWEWGSYLGDGALEQGVDVCVSSWTRSAQNTFPALAKSAANYANAALIKMEATLDGYSEGIALNPEGHLSEGSGQNLFLVRDEVLYTPPLSASILPGITRDTVITLAQDLGFQVKEIDLPREMLYMADEIFFVGTAAEITPIRSVDKIAVGAGARGPITAALQQAFFDYINGVVPDRHGWLQSVDIRSAKPEPAGTR
jgi:branched-chain amino acid aminotransferase